jgi:hypothetical protein
MLVRFGSVDELELGGQYFGEPIRHDKGAIPQRRVLVRAGSVIVLAALALGRAEGLGFYRLLVPDADAVVADGEAAAVVGLEEEGPLPGKVIEFEAAVAGVAARAGSREGQRLRRFHVELRWWRRSPQHYGILWDRFFFWRTL